tara:strand:+ start:5107 stop:6699 length:1593 start_codon:yes stop_codon:yes gene_type:complete
MTKRKRILLIITSIIVIILLILSIYANAIAKTKIEALIKDKMPAHIESTYKDLNINVLTGSVTVKEPSLLIKVKDSSIIHTQLKMSSLVIGNISYWDYFINDKIHIGKLEFKELNTIHYKNRTTKAADSSNTKEESKFLNSIQIDKINLENASAIIYDGRKDSLLLSLTNTSLLIKDILIDETTSTGLIPFSYKKLKMEADSVFYKAGKYENIQLNQLLLEDETLTLNGFHYKTKYTKKDYSRLLTIERDYYDIEIADLIINEFAVGYLQNDSLFFKTHLIEVDNATAAFYRDKLIADDLKIKKLYSRAIRELPLKLTIDSISIKNSQVEYSEKVHLENPAGVLTIKDINAGITNISNTYSSPEKTAIIVDGTFMKNTPIHVNWSFDVNDTSDLFRFVGYAGSLELSDMNVFLTPLLNARVRGEVKETNFIINGNYNQSKINLSQDYNSIDLIILNKRKTRNKFLSAVANVFINSESGDKNELFHNVTTDATRDKTKSFFNYLAKNLKNGLLVNFTHKNNTVTKKKKKRN